MKPRLSKNNVEMWANVFITLSLDDYNSPFVDLLSRVIYRLQPKGIRRPRSFLAFYHFSIFKTIYFILVSVTHKILHWSWSSYSHKWGHRDVVTFYLSHRYFFLSPNPGHFQTLESGNFWYVPWLWGKYKYSKLCWQILAFFIFLKIKCYYINKTYCI